MIDSQRRLDTVFLVPGTWLTTDALMKCGPFSRAALHLSLLFATFHAATLLAQPTNSSGAGLLFTAATGYALVASNASLTLNNQYTFEAWVFPQEAKCNTILSRGDGSGSSDYIFQVGYDGTTCGTMRVALFAGGAWESSSMTVPLSTWTHVAVTFDGANKIFYVNGVPDPPRPRTATAPQNAGSLYIGRQGSTCNCNFFRGGLDDIRIWNTVRTATQVSTNKNRPLVGSEAGLVAYYRFDEGTGSSLADATGNGNHGALAGSYVWLRPSGAPIGIGAQTLAASDLAPNSAVLNGRAYPNNQPVIAWFNFGTNTNYGSSTPATNLPGSSSFIAVSNTISGLVPGGTYHFQLMVTNDAGAIRGDDVAFQTPFWGKTFALPGFSSGTAAWGDFDNDGYLDILVTGYTGGGTLGRAELWRNLGNGAFTNLNLPLAAVYSGSVAVGDLDNDGNLDFLLTGYNGANPVLQLWRNLGNWTFTNINSSLPRVFYSSVALGDLDNDGRLDIVVAGQTDSGLVSQFWRNLGNWTFTNLTPDLPGVTAGSVALGDFDKDGMLDILLTGGTVTGPVSQLWRNLGNGVFTNMNVALPGVANSSVAVGDVDSDGKLDVLLAGASTSGRVAQIWRNLGNFTFTNLNVTLPGLDYAAVAFGDFDNDGKLDIVLGGNSGSSPAVTVQIWRNLGGNVFTNANAGLPALYFPSVVIADFNNDAKLDMLLLGGDTFGVPRADVLQSVYSAANGSPTAPSGLNVTQISQGAVFQWNPAGDSETAAAGLSYNLRVGTSPGASDIISPASAATGFRRIVQLGNAQQRQFTEVTNLTIGKTYYWSVQSIDGAFAGSAFASEAVFVMRPRFTSFGRGADGRFRAQLNVVADTNYVIQASSDLVNWIDVFDFSFESSGPVVFTDPATNYPNRFYRFRQY